jgi:hypothetical protein
MAASDNHAGGMMEWEFESLPFGSSSSSSSGSGGTAAALEMERGARVFARPPVRAARPRPAPRSWPRPAPRPWPRPAPRPWPVRGAIWPWQPVVLDVFGAPDARPAGMPDDAPEDMPDNAPAVAPDDAQEELPPQVASALRLLRVPARPHYRSLGSLDQAARHSAAARPGLYLIEFLVNGKPQAYSGKAADVRTRLRDHLREVRRWGVPPAGYQVYAAFNAAYADPETLRRVEAALHDALFRASRGYLRNRQREF